MSMACSKRLFHDVRCCHDLSLRKRFFVDDHGSKTLVENAGVISCNSKNWDRVVQSSDHVNGNYGFRGIGIHVNKNSGNADGGLLRVLVDGHLCNYVVILDSFREFACEASFHSLANIFSMGVHRVRNNNKRCGDLEAAAHQVTTLACVQRSRCKIVKGASYCFCKKSSSSSVILQAQNSIIHTRVIWHPAVVLQLQ
jgi:hypothetical protein